MHRTVDQSVVFHSPSRNSPMRVFSLLVIVFALILLPSSALAGSVVGRVAYLTVRASDGLVYVNMDVPATGQPPCATNPYFVLTNENTDTGKKQFAQLLAAKLTGQTITITGANACTRWPDGEDILATIM